MCWRPKEETIRSRRKLMISEADENSVKMRNENSLLSSAT